MNQKELLQQIQANPVSLSDKIREGSIPFADVVEVIDNNDVPIIIKISCLIHPDCTIEEFKKRYFKTLKNKEHIARNPILTKALLFKHLEIIAFVLGADDVSKEAIIKSYGQNNKDQFKKLIKNPNIHKDFFLIYFDASGDSTHLPEDIAKIVDCFTF